MVSMNKDQLIIYEMQAKICQALSHPIRLLILDLISDKELTSSALLELVKIPKANLSQHLNVLKDAGILKSRKDGQFQFISLAIPQIKEACGLICKILTEKISEDERRMAEIRKGLNVQAALSKAKEKKENKENK